MRRSHFTLHGRMLMALLGTLSLTPLAALAQGGRPPAGRDQPQTLEDLASDTELPLTISGFGVGNYDYEGRTGQNSFAASKLAVSLFREVNDYVWLFGQLTTALAEGDGGGGEVATETEIDNLIVSVTPPGLSSVSIAAGRFDVPIGFERDDEPLNLQPSRTFNAELARPTKMVGLVGRWAAGPKVDLAALVSNGWDAQLAPNHGKTGGVRLGVLPTEHTSIGLAGLYGREGEQDSTTDRYVLTLDYAVQPSPDWIVAGEANLGGDRGANPDGSDARWYGGTMTVFGRLAGQFGAVVRAEVFRDRDGARTGQPQTLTSYTIAPVYLLGTGREGIFANIEHTTFRIPRFQLRAEARINHSSEPYFEIASGLGNWNVEYVVQLVTLF
jgi:hypothetical protein